MKRIIIPAILLVVWACSSSHPTTAAEEASSATATPMATATSLPSEKSVPHSEVVKAAPNSPTEVIQRYTEELRGIVEPGKRKEKGSRDVKQEEKIAQKVREFFDFDGLARMSLGKHWYKITPKQQKEFSTVFIDLVETSYLRRSRNIIGDYNIVYGKEEIKKDQSKVKCSVIRNDANVDITYELHRNPKNWMIFNIILDDVDLVKNYQSQFNRIIQVAGFKGLMKRMRQKQQEGATEPTL